MSELKLFLPHRGVLSARMLPPPDNELVYNITIPVSAELDPPKEHSNDWQTETSVRLEFIRIGAVNWRDLAGRKFTFPINPTQGYVDGSVYFNGAHHYADLTQLNFGQQIATSIQAQMDITFNFYADSALPYLPEKISVQWKLELETDRSHLDKVMTEAGAIG